MHLKTVFFLAIISSIGAIEVERVAAVQPKRKPPTAREEDENYPSSPADQGKDEDAFRQVREEEDWRIKVKFHCLFAMVLA